MRNNEKPDWKLRRVLVALVAGCLTATGVYAGDVLAVGPGQAYATIQSAVDAAQPGDAIRVYPATYPESVSVSKSHISILAQGSGVVVGPPPSGNQACFSVSADGVVVQGFELTGTDCAPAIGFEGSYNRFLGNKIYGLTCPGVNAIECRAPGGGSNYNLIQDNDITDADLGVVVGSETTKKANKGNAIVGNYIHAVGTVGIAVYNAIETTVQGNVIDGVAFGLGISISTLGGDLPQHSHLVSGNSVSNTTEGAIGVFADQKRSLTKVTISYNQIDSPGAIGIFLQKDPGAHLADNVISGNCVRSAQQVGIDLEDGVNKNTVEGNLAVDSGLYGIQVAGKNNKLDANTALGNSTYDLLDAGKGNKWKENVYETCSWSQ